MGSSGQTGSGEAEHSRVPPSLTLPGRLIIAFSSGLYSGYFPVASGTAGTAVAVLFYLPLGLLNRPAAEGGNPLAYMLIVALVTVLGVFAAQFAEKYHGGKDPGKVVIDEFAGYFVTMTALPFDWRWILAGFFVFRVFDVLKPWPARRLESLRGGLGIVIDDVFAGFYSCLTLHAALYALGRM